MKLKEILNMTYFDASPSNVEQPKNLSLPPQKQFKKGKKVAYIFQYAFVTDQSIESNRNTFM